MMLGLLVASGNVNRQTHKHYSCCISIEMCVCALATAVWASKLKFEPGRLQVIIWKHMFFCFRKNYHLFGRFVPFFHFHKFMDTTPFKWSIMTTDTSNYNLEQAESVVYGWIVSAQILYIIKWRQKSKTLPDVWQREVNNVSICDQ